MARQRSGGHPAQGLPDLPGMGEEAQDDVKEYPLFEMALLTRLRTPDTKVGVRGRSYVSQNRVSVRLCAHMQRGCTSITILVCSNGKSEMAMKCLILPHSWKPVIMKNTMKAVLQY